jgi:hypothetical protein
MWFFAFSVAPQASPTTVPARRDGHKPKTTQAVSSTISVERFQDRIANRAIAATVFLRRTTLLPVRVAHARNLALLVSTK